MCFGGCTVVGCSEVAQAQAQETTECTLNVTRETVLSGCVVCADVSNGKEGKLAVL